MRHLKPKMSALSAPATTRLRPAVRAVFCALALVAAGRLACTCEAATAAANVAASAAAPAGAAASAQSLGANADANRLYEDLMMSYNRFVRPVQNDSDLLVVKLGLKLSQLIDVVSSPLLARPRARARDTHAHAQI